MATKELSPYASQSSLSIPEYFVDSAWLGHAPFAFHLISALRPKCLVELGTHYGFSYFCFCQAIKQAQTGTVAYSVDTWTGDEHSGFYTDEIFQSVQTQNKQYKGFSTLMRMRFDEAVSYFIDKSIDILHIDGRHFYDDAKIDFETWLPKLSNSAIVLFHDTNVRERDFGVFRLFSELRSSYSAFEFHHGSGLGIIAIGEPPTAIKSFFAADESESRDFQRLYASLGRNMEEFNDQRVLQSDVNLHIQQIARLQSDANLHIQQIARLQSDANLHIQQIAQMRAEIDQMAQDAQSRRITAIQADERAEALSLKLEFTKERLADESDARVLATEKATPSLRS